jgi:2-methylcitrate dehydratase PrpD
VAAFIVGAEVAARLLRASQRLSNDGGWHSTGTVGAIATAAACAKLMKLPAEKITDVLGISVSLASGVAVNYGTMTKPLHSGNAARNGILAAQLQDVHPWAFGLIRSVQGPRQPLRSRCPRL